MKLLWVCARCRQVEQQDLHCKHTAWMSRQGTMPSALGRSRWNWRHQSLGQLLSHSKLRSARMRLQGRYMFLELRDVDEMKLDLRSAARPGEFPPSVQAALEAHLFSLSPSLLTLHFFFLFSSDRKRNFSGDIQWDLSGISGRFS